MRIVKCRRLWIALAAVTVAVSLGAGCGSQEASSTQASSPESATAQGSSTQASSITGAKAALMLGRSVMWGWFKHWGWDGTPESLPIEKNGYALTYREIATPPDIAASATGFMDEVPQGTIVFFKFCFDDFPGAEEAASRFEEQKDWIETVAAKAQARNLPLIIGNALPKVAMSTDPTLVAEHREFNAWLEQFAGNSGGAVHVYDLYGILAGPDGALKAEYATSSDDSHPNDEGYAALDPSLFQLLGQVSQ
jgi:hypothetical protein